MVDVDEIVRDIGEDNISKDNNNETANGNGKDEKDQDNKKIADIMVELPAIIEYMMDSENRLNNEKRLDAYILIKVITYLFRISSSESKASSSVSSHSLDILTSSLDTLFSGLPMPHLSNFVDSSWVPLSVYFLRIFPSMLFFCLAFCFLILVIDLCLVFLLEFFFQ